MRRFWWVNHGGTFTRETGGGYIWAPRADENQRGLKGHVNLTQVRRGDLILSYADKAVRCIGVAQASATIAERPASYRRSSFPPNGWRVEVQWQPLNAPIAPLAFFEQLAPLLSEKYAPLNHANGHGNLSMYLSEISEEVVAMVLSHGGHLPPAAEAFAGIDDEVLSAVADEAAVRSIKSDRTLTETERKVLILARRGQGLYKENLRDVEKGCRLTAIFNPAFLVASHIKPWAKSDNVERLDGHNGLLLAPHVDRLFDRGWISFTDGGDVLVATKSAEDALNAWGLPHPVKNVGIFSAKQKAYLAYHREVLFAKKHVS
ncbi:HNH endonuclease [Xylophilus sp. Kf1]|nr:HNH endonuclease [Xylophilus sp. Kf1]